MATFLPARFRDSQARIQMVDLRLLPGWRVETVWRGFSRNPPVVAPDTLLAGRATFSNSCANPKQPESGMNIGWCPATRVPELQAFIAEHWRAGHVLARDADLLRWQFRDPSDPERLSAVTAWNERDELIGFLGRIRADFSRYGSRVPATWLAMWMVIPGERYGFLAYTMFREAMCDAPEIVCGLGLNHFTRTIFRGRGFVVVDNIPRWILVISPSALVRLLEGWPGGYAAHALDAWYRVASRPGYGARAPEPRVRLLDWHESLAPRWDESWQGRFAPRLLGTWRDADYVTWRYVGHPTFRYVVQLAEHVDDGALIGLVVYRVEAVADRAERVLRVVEFLAEDPAVVPLGAAVFHAGRVAGAAFADFYCTSHALDIALGRAGFVREDDMPAGLPHLFQPLDFRRQGLNGAFRIMSASAGTTQPRWDAATLYVTSSDGDQDRPN